MTDGEAYTRIPRFMIVRLFTVTFQEVARRGLRDRNCVNRLGLPFSTVAVLAL